MRISESRGLHTESWPQHEHVLRDICSSQVLCMTGKVRGAPEGCWCAQNRCAAETQAHNCLGELAITNGDYEEASNEFEQVRFSLQPMLNTECQALEISSADTRGVMQAKSARCAIGLAKGNAQLEQHMKDVAAQLAAR